MESGEKKKGYASVTLPPIFFFPLISNIQEDFPYD